MAKSKSVTIAPEVLARLVRHDLEAHAAGHGASYLSVAVLARDLGDMSVDALEGVCRGLPDVSVATAAEAEEANAALGEAFKRVERPGKEKGFYPGVRLVGDAEWKAIAARNARIARACELLHAAIEDIGLDVQWSQEHGFSLAVLDGNGDVDHAASIDTVLRNLDTAQSE